MARKLRVFADGGLYHVINRRLGRLALFEEPEDYLAFIKVMDEVAAEYPVRVLAYCLMPNHWHLLLWPQRAKAIPAFMQRLTVTHLRRWHAHRQSAGMGSVYQGRYKSFPIQDDGHFLVVARYVERNALRAKLAKRAEDWPWCSLHARLSGASPQWLAPAADWPVPMRRDWPAWVNGAETAKELDALRTSVNRGRPFGQTQWQQQTAAKLKLQQTLNDPWRPKKVRSNPKKGT